MATVHLDPTSLTIRFTLAEKVGGLIRDIHVPLARVRTVTVEDDGIRAARGLRAPGLALPGRRKIGTWRGRGRRSAVSVRRGQPALRITLEGDRWSELVIGADDAAAVASRLQAATAG